MKNLGIIAEYNPFHNGHLYHIKKSKNITKADNVIVVMSGNYVQRGTPSFCDKYLRTKMALKNGADMVIELPVYYSTSSAEFFSNASIKLLDSLGIIDYICFGIEDSNLNNIYKCAKILCDETYEFKILIKNYLKLGLSFPAARENALKTFLNTEDLSISKPNNILGVEYIKTLIKLNSNIKPIGIKRHISNHNSKNILDEISSATAIRNSILNKNYNDIYNSIPINLHNDIKNILKNNLYFSDINDISLLLNFIIKTNDTKYLNSILDVEEGLENRILKKSDTHFKVTEIIENIKTKRYTFTKIQRMLLHILLGITKNDFEKFNNCNGPQYIRILGFNKNKSFLFKEIEKKSKLPIITNLKNANNNLDNLGKLMLKKEIETTDIYYMLLNNKLEKPIMKNSEFYKPLIII